MIPDGGVEDLGLAGLKAYSAAATAAIHGLAVYRILRY